MKDKDKTKEQLIDELRELRQQAAALEVLEAERKAMIESRMDAKIGENETRYRELVNLLPVTVFEVDEHGNFQFFNHQASKISGYTPEDIDNGLNARNLFIPEDRDRVAENIRRVLNGERFKGNDYTILRKDGSTFPVIIYSSPIIVGNRALGLRGVAIDVTERQQMEAMLNDSEEKYRNLVERANDGIGIVQDSMLVHANQRLLAMLGYTAEEIIGSAFFGLIMPEELEKVVNYYKRRMASAGILPIYELKLRHKDGSRIDVEINAGVTSYKGKPADLALVRDITERKQLEKALQESELRYRTIFERAPMGIGLATLEGQFLDCNANMLQITGYSLQELRKINVGDTYFKRRDRIRIWKRLKRREVVQDIEVQLLRKDGTPYYADLTVAPIILHGKDVGLAIWRDVTKVKQADEKIMKYHGQLKSLASELSLSEERERRRISMYLHDHIGHALAMCKIKLGLLRESLPPTYRDGYFDEVNGIIEQAIQCSRSLTFELSPPVLYELGLRAAVKWLAEKICKENGILIDVESHGHLQTTDDDIKIILFQAARELLINIIKHAQAQNVKISMRKYSKKIRIDVIDDGVGFDTSQLYSSIAKNSALGLFNIQERLSYIGGHCDIQSKPGCGTSITIAAPLKDKE